MKQYAIVTLTARPAEFTNSTYALSVRAAEVSFIFSTTKQISRNVHRKKNYTYEPKTIPWLKNLAGCLNK